ncbi:hypothetical protein GCM10009664_09060 [Kitasatospora gansuensis]
MRRKGSTRGKYGIPRWAPAVALAVGVAAASAGLVPSADALKAEDRAPRAKSAVTAAGEAGGSRAPRTAGVPAAPVKVYDEDFENVAAGSEPVLLSSYKGASGETYTADPAWLQDCNGWVLNKADSAGFGQGLSECQDAFFWDELRDITAGIGSYEGLPVPASNHAVAGFTKNQAVPVDAVEFRTVEPIPLGSANRFLTAAVTSGAGNCNLVGPRLQFDLVDGTTEYPVTDEPINPCTDTDRKEYPGVQSPVFVVHKAADKPKLYPGTSVGVVMRNAETTPVGNDAAFDDIQVLDVTPQVDKSFSPSPVAVGATSTLTFTVTNTSDLLAKQGWSFADHLPPGLTVAGTAKPTTSCTNGKVAATAGGTSVGLSGDLDAGQASCTLSVDVTSGTAGTYRNCADNTSDLVGVLPPACATVVFDTPHYEITKTANPAAGSSIAPGTKVAYTVVVRNTGTLPVDATAVDDLSGVLDDAVYDDADASSGTVTYAAPKLSWSGTLQPGQSATVTYSVTVNTPDTGDRKLHNHVTGDRHSNCLTGSEAGCISDLTVGGLVVSKTADASSAEPGQRVTYTLKVTNPNGSTYPGATVTDDLTNVLDDATWGNDATTTSGTVTYAAPVLSWTGDVPAGRTVTITYSVTADNPDIGDHRLDNTIVGPAGSNCAAGSSDTDCSTHGKVAPSPSPSASPRPSPSPSPSPNPAPLPNTGGKPLIRYAGLAAALALAAGILLTAVVRRRSRS